MNIMSTGSTNLHRRAWDPATLTLRQHGRVVGTWIPTTHSPQGIKAYVKKLVTVLALEQDPRLEIQDPDPLASTPLAAPEGAKEHE